MEGKTHTQYSYDTSKASYSIPSMAYRNFRYDIPKMEKRGLTDINLHAAPYVRMAHEVAICSKYGLYNSPST